MTKAWIAATNRRRTLAAILAGALGALGLAREGADAAKSGKCKNKCGQCQLCKRGKCKNKNGKKRCKKGKCTPVERGTPCGGDGCSCSRSIEGDAFCDANIAVLCVEGACGSSGECPAGHRCFRCASGATACVLECGEI